MTRAVIAVALLWAVAYIAVLVFVLWMAAKSAPKSRVYDCSLVEISPDVPPAAREACRKRLRGG